MSQQKQNLTWYIIAAMILGAITGQLIHIYFPEIIQIKDASGVLKDIVRSEHIGQYFKILTGVFLRLVQMIIAPLVITTLIVGIAKMGNLKSVGRVGGRSMIWFFSASLASLLLGLLLVNYFKPGESLHLNINALDTSAAADVIGKTQSFSIQHFIEHLFPKSLFEALATNEILQIVVFSIFFGIALTQYGEKGESIVKFLDNLSKVILILVGYVMWFAPLGVFGGITAIIATKGLGILKVYGYYMASFYVGLTLLWILLLAVGYFILRKRLGALLNHLKTPLMVAFSTTSSEAVFPKLTEELEKFGCRKKIVSFILPLGYSFNLDGSMMYMTFASIFIAQAYGIPLDLGTQLTMLLVLMLTSKGIAGVPRASLVVVAATCAMFDIPAEGIALILPIDHFCDMGRSMTNVLGNGLATAAVDKWEND
ncbi:MAG: dicarboxylate/amino acid:cation symporter [Flavobacteriaceae bacterium]|nr:dicarboxylate/amino acid:cation symporter [Flavobacteriaceae bacterium]PHX76993.1 MAG: dicarboxylate/amino acid:cation symporter [Flavobacteriales bacterium]